MFPSTHASPPHALWLPLDLRAFALPPPSFMTGTAHDAATALVSRLEEQLVRLSPTVHALRNASCNSIDAALSCLHRQIDVLCEERALRLELLEARRTAGGPWPHELQEDEEEVRVLNKSIEVLQSGANSLTMVLTDLEEDDNDHGGTMSSASVEVSVIRSHSVLGEHQGGETAGGSASSSAVS